MLDKIIIAVIIAISAVMAAVPYLGFLFGLGSWTKVTAECVGTRDRFGDGLGPDGRYPVFRYDGPDGPCECAYPYPGEQFRVGKSYPMYARKGAGEVRLFCPYDRFQFLWAGIFALPGVLSLIVYFIV